MTKEEIAQNKHFLLLPQCFQLFVIVIHSIIEIFYLLTKYVQSSAAELSYEGRGLKEIFFVHKTKYIVDSGDKAHISYYKTISFDHKNSVVGTQK